MNRFYHCKETHINTVFLQDDFGNQGIIFHDIREDVFWKIFINFKYSKHCLVETKTLPPLAERIKPLLDKGMDIIGLYPLEGISSIKETSERFNKPTVVNLYKANIDRFFKYLRYRYPDVRSNFMTRQEYEEIMPKEKPKKFKPMPKL